MFYIYIIQEIFNPSIAQTDADNLFCCFRWLLILFKREFSLNAITYLWERLWSSQMKQFQSFIALSLLEAVRPQLLNLKAFDEILKFINELSGQFDVDSVIWRAYLLHEKFTKKLKYVCKERLQLEIVDFSDLDHDDETPLESLKETELSDEELSFLVPLL
jgi:hypothetical protein